MRMHTGVRTKADRGGRAAHVQPRPEVRSIPPPPTTATPIFSANSPRGVPASQYPSQPTFLELAFFLTFAKSKPKTDYVSAQRV